MPSDSNVVPRERLRKVTRRSDATTQTSDKVEEKGESAHTSKNDDSTSSVFEGSLHGYSTHLTRHDLPEQSKKPEDSDSSESFAEDFESVASYCSEADDVGEEAEDSQPKHIEFIEEHPVEDAPSKSDIVIEKQSVLVPKHGRRSDTRTYITGSVSEAMANEPPPPPSDDIKKTSTRERRRAVARHSTPLYLPSKTIQKDYTSKDKETAPPIDISPSIEDEIKAVEEIENRTVECNEQPEVLAVEENERTSPVEDINAEPVEIEQEPDIESVNEEKVVVVEDHIPDDDVTEVESKFSDIFIAPAEQPNTVNNDNRPAKDIPIHPLIYDTEVPVTTTTTKQVFMIPAKPKYRSNTRRSAALRPGSNHGLTSDETLKSKKTDLGVVSNYDPVLQSEVVTVETTTLRKQRHL